MGVYLSKPITDKISTDEENVKMKFGASSMQGWRETQEDAHNCILDYDEDTQFFAVYDGHGGHEVAQYCSQKLPQFIKNTDAYKNGDLSNALIDGFLGFDATLTSKEVIDELVELMKDPKDECETSDEESVSKLYEEASMPLDKVIEKYMLTKNMDVSRVKEGVERKPLSPCLRAKKGSKSSDEEAVKVDESDSAVTTKEDNQSTNTDNTIAQPEAIATSSGASSSCKHEKTISTNDVSDSKENIEQKIVANDIPEGSQSISGYNKKDIKQDVVTSTNGNNQEENNEIENKVQTKKEESLNKQDVVDVVKPQENGKVSKKGKGKALAKTKGIVPVTKKIRPKRTATQLYLDLLESECSSESEDDQDKTFQGPIELSSSDEEAAANVSVEACDENSGASDSEKSDEKDSDAEDDDAEEEEDEEEDDNEHDLQDDNIPGAGSGCTAVVALMHGNEIVVANAGDSRCIVCRNGKAVDLSIDHKPENREEYERITKAGGEVDYDGRVDGGLNLSRAIGDHIYKLNKDLSDREQRITALPDIQTFTVTQSDEFMILACDGIWNFMTSQKVVDFVKCRLEKQPEQLSQICEELFDNCLAPDTLGDGTGCDNMTAIIVSFKKAMFKRGAPSDAEEVVNPKRVKTDEENIVEAAV